MNLNCAAGRASWLDRFKRRTPTTALAVTIWCAVLLPPSLWAQRGQLIGTVRDSSGSPVSNAGVSARDARMHTRTDDRGHFRFTNLPVGALELTIRRLGFDPVRLTVQVIEASPDTTHIVLVDNAEQLAAVTVSAEAARQRKSIEAFYERAARGVGTYITRDDIIARRATSILDVLRGIPGLVVLRGRADGGVRFNTSAQMRRDCAPTVWVDGQRAPGMEVGDVPVHDLEGIELYHGPSTTPMQFSQGPSGAACGVVVLWTRLPASRGR